MSYYMVDSYTMYNITCILLLDQLYNGLNLIVARSLLQHLPQSHCELRFPHITLTECIVMKPDIELQAKLLVCSFQPMDEFLFLNVGMY